MESEWDFPRLPLLPAIKAHVEKMQAAFDRWHNEETEEGKDLYWEEFSNLASERYGLSLHTVETLLRIIDELQTKGGAR